MQDLSAKFLYEGSERASYYDECECFTYYVFCFIFNGLIQYEEMNEWNTYLERRRCFTIIGDTITDSIE